MRVIKNIIKNAIKNIMLFIDDIWYLLCGVLYIIKVKPKKEYQSLKMLSADDKILILCNGPSANEINAKNYKDKGYKIACVNYFPATYDRFFELKPDYLFLIDPLFFNGKLDKKSDEYTRYQQMIGCLSRVNWKLNIVCIRNSKLGISNSNISYIWLNSNQLIPIFNFTRKQVNLSRVQNFLLSRNLGNIGYQNVFVGCLYYFIASDAKEVLFAGADMSEWKGLFVDEDNRVYCEKEHFYGKRRYYYDEYPQYERSSMYEMMQIFAEVFLQIHKMYKYSLLKSTNIVNLSPKSFIDEFIKQSNGE